MIQKNDIEKKVEAALNSLDGLERATPQPWLYARVKGRLQREERTPWEAVSKFLSKPVIALAGVTAILLLNVALLLGKEETQPTIASQTDQQQTVAESESIIASNSSFDYEKFVQP